jgi:chemotaxis protein methyltransferase CheR
MSIFTDFNLTEEVFRKFRALIYERAGISMNDAKRALVAGRLRKRLVALNLESYDEYYRFLKKEEKNDTGELQRFTDLLTTNETWFFREQRHFDFLRQTLSQRDRSQTVEVWSAACSSGEEPYSIAMTIAEANGLNRPWHILATDISSNILTRARKGIYEKSKIKGLTEHLMHRYMLNGVNKYQDYIAVAPELKKRISFKSYNLIDSPLPTIKFDFIFCRNVLIYFNQQHKQEVVQRLVDCLKPGGYLLPGHAESLHGFTTELRIIEPSIYQKVRNIAHG